MVIKVQIFKDKKLPSIDEMSDDLKIPECGAISSFSGNRSLHYTIRNHKKQF
jgi:hypothetical protein